MTGDLENSLERIAARLDDDKTINMASDDVCADVVDRLMPSSLIGFLAELALGSYADLPQPEERDVLTEALDLFKAPNPTLVPFPKKNGDGENSQAQGVDAAGEPENRLPCLRMSAQLTTSAFMGS